MFSSDSVPREQIKEGRGAKNNAAEVFADPAPFPLPPYFLPSAELANLRSMQSIMRIRRGWNGVSDSCGLPADGRTDGRTDRGAQLLMLLITARSGLIEKAISPRATRATRCSKRNYNWRRVRERDMTRSGMPIGDAAAAAKAPQRL